MRTLCNANGLQMHGPTHTATPHTTFTTFSTRRRTSCVLITLCFYMCIALIFTHTLHAYSNTSHITLAPAMTHLHTPIPIC
mmetsp:Transcript_36743/g.83161  ORF Transcript_36743/g.83161 Transcript_36743/m.83161 type:complete len:81 (+) Transcript_36743:200-442(+)